MQKEIANYYSPVGVKKRERSKSSPEAGQRPEKRKTVVQEVGMDDKKMKALLDSLENRLMESINGTLSKLATKEDMVSLKMAVQNVVAENVTLRGEIDALSLSNQKLVNRVVELEDRSRRNNLVFKGLQYELGGADYVAIVRDFCINFLGCRKEIYINRAHLLGNRKVAGPIIAHLPVDDDVNFVLRNAKKLKGTHFFIHKDFSFETRKARAKLLALRKVILSYQPREKVIVTHDRMIVKGVVFKWDDGIGLQSGNRSGEEKLRGLIGRCAEEVLEKFKEEERKRGYEGISVSE